MDRWEVRRDGKTLAALPEEWQAWRWLLDHQSSSVRHATKYEGYSITPVVTIR